MSSDKTRRAYLAEPYRRNFTARVHAVEERGGRPAALLAETWFYPEGGGQPADRGSLGPARVLDVEEDAGGEILHVLDRPIPPGEHTAALDWARRFDHMQQHSGQHLLSRCFEEVAGAATVSFHLGVDEVTIDLEVPDLAPERAAEAETLANRTVLDNLAVGTVEVEPDAAAAMGVTYPAAVPGLVRVVTIGDFDRTACSGTHVRATGEIGPVKVRRLERTRGRMRVAFHCGLRSLADYAWRHDALRDLANLLTTGEREAPGLLARMIAERRDLERRVRELEAEVAHHRAARAVEGAERVGPSRLVVTAVETVEMARALATALAATPGVVALLGAAGNRPRLLFAAAEDVAVDLAAVMREVAPLLGGKGGGRPRWAEAGGQDPGRLGDALAAAAARVRAALAG